MPATTINVNDSGVVQPSVRVGWNLGSSRSKGAPSDPGSGHTHGHGIEFGATRASSEDTQSLAVGQSPVRFGGTVFLPGQTLRHEADFAVYDVSYRFRLFSADRAIGMEVTAGVAYADLGLTVSSSSQRAKESLSSMGVRYGIAGIGRLRPGTQLHARVTGFYSGDYHDITTAYSSELSVGQALGSNVVVRGGYAYTSAESDRDGPDSKISLRFSGPLLRLELQF
jgi:hypothetical protein